MTTFALIGGDGAGKTTIAEYLVTSGRFQAKYVYMGISAQSADRLLPTSRIVLELRRRAYRKEVARQTGRPPQDSRIPADRYEYSGRERHALWVTARAINRFLEAWYRQLISFTYQLRGHLVIYDRHFLFDTGVLAPQLGGRRSAPERIFGHLMRHFFPRPDAVLFLDSPGHVLYSRKGEGSVEYLDSEARMYLAQAAAVKHFVRVDASQPLEHVKREASDTVAALLRVIEG